MLFIDSFLPISHLGKKFLLILISKILPSMLSAIFKDIWVPKVARLLLTLNHGRKLFQNKIRRGGQRKPNS
ncbi:hypothetical protein RirG_012030 [Rhizophagus irregularis DAOM 197198w]|uniref:Uncharacterized protein n=1 Tax=Rhizophagus irregularis (strain DAOM 197198w) TaxID=1432141 RepID=A0A015KAJ1_RHIIW|nr:hypothetical protein RirG_012030 [Rhizophagus irregularis DAOM 197198w]